MEQNSPQINCRGLLTTLNKTMNPDIYANEPIHLL